MAAYTGEKLLERYSVAGCNVQRETNGHTLDMAHPTYVAISLR